MTGAVALRLAGLAVDAGGERILGPLDLALPEGECVLVVGPSGSGKTTLLRAIAGLAVPAAGTVELFGKPASEPGRLRVPPEERRVGLLFQGGALWPHLSCERTLAFVLRRRGLRGAPARERVEELLGEVELAGFERRMPATLSGGERQRLALARAMAGEPRILLLDEPLGPLDEELRQGLLRRLDDLRKRRGWTVLHVTHNPGEARGFASRTLRMDGGRLVDEGGTA